MKYLLNLLIICTIFSCNKTEKEKIISTYKNGNPEIVVYYPNSKDTLTYRKAVFYKSGKLHYIGYIEDNSKNGTWTWWFENGNKKDQCKYEKGFYVDTVYHWYENGELKQTEIVANQKVRADECCNCNGKITKYFENGKIKEQFTSLDNKYQGTYIIYDEEGSWIKKFYKDGVLDGPIIEHLVDSNEIKNVFGQYENGKEAGLWKWYDQDSILTQTAIYKNGIINGDYIKYYSNGKIKEKGIVVNGEYQGELMYYNESGKLVKTEFYNNGKLQRTKMY